MKIVLTTPDDWHVHLRQGEALESYAQTHATGFGRVMAMPNTIPPLVTVEHLVEYRKHAESAASGLTVLPAFRLMPTTSAEDVAKLSQFGVPAGKYYPDGATTNSSGGLVHWRQIEEALAAMEEHDVVLSIHGENPSAPVLEREEAFLPVLAEIRQSFPKLRIILEHVSTAAGVHYVMEDQGPTAATITLHHLLFTLDDLLGGSLDAHLFCKPVVKTAADREALTQRILASDSRFFFGSDSAPHPVVKKQSGRAPAGSYSAPVLLPALAQWFEEHQALEKMQPFLCEFGAAFYGYEANTGRVILEKKNWEVPELVDGCVPLLAGTTLSWKVLRREG